MPGVFVGLGLDRCHCGGRLSAGTNGDGRVVQWCDRCPAVSCVRRIPPVSLTEARSTRPAKSPSACAHEGCPEPRIPYNRCCLVHASSPEYRASNRAKQQANRARKASLRSAGRAA